MVYHSRWNGYEEGVLLGCGLFPIKVTCQAAAVGPAPRMDPLANDDGNAEDKEDVLDEALFYFKSNMLFKTYTIKGSGDRLLLYLTMFMNNCLKRIVGLNRAQAKATLLSYASDSVTAPTDPSFQFSSFFPAAKSNEEVDQWKEYVKQLRMEISSRLLRLVFQFPEADGTGSKFWMIFGKSTFLSSSDK